MSAYSWADTTWVRPTLDIRTNAAGDDWMEDADGFWGVTVRGGGGDASVAAAGAGGAGGAHAGAADAETDPVALERALNDLGMLATQVAFVRAPPAVRAREAARRVKAERQAARDAQIAARAEAARRAPLPIAIPARSKGKVRFGSYGRQAPAEARSIVVSGLSEHHDVRVVRSMFRGFLCRVSMQRDCAAAVAEAEASTADVVGPEDDGAPAVGAAPSEASAGDASHSAAAARHSAVVVFDDERDMEDALAAFDDLGTGAHARRLEGDDTDTSSESSAPAEGDVAGYDAEVVAAAEAAGIPLPPPPGPATGERERGEEAAAEAAAPPAASTLADFMTVATARPRQGEVRGPGRRGRRGRRRGDRAEPDLLDEDAGFDDAMAAAMAASLADAPPAPSAPPAAAADAPGAARFPCPIGCGAEFTESEMDAHVDECLTRASGLA